MSNTIEYNPKYCEKIQPLAPLGCTDEQIAMLFDVTPETIHDWMGAHPEFSRAINRAKLRADMKVSHALYQQAISGNVQAQIFWLKNRQPQIWRDKQEIDLRAPDGLRITGIDPARLTDEELQAMWDQQKPQGSDGGL
jgi:hypothetical protein